MVHRASRILHPAFIVFIIWMLVAAWHPFFLGFFSDDWALFVSIKGNNSSIAELVKQYPNYPLILLEQGVAPAIAANRPIYALIVFIFKAILSDSTFFWQVTSALLLAAAAIPVVATNIYGLTDAVHDGFTGILVKPQDSIALALALKELISNDALRTNLGKQARERVIKEFDMNCVNNHLIQEYQRLLREIMV